MGVIQVGVPVSAGTLFRGAVSANATSYAGRPGAVAVQSWDDEEEFDTEVEVEVVEDEVVEAQVPVKRGPGRPRKVK